MEKWIVLSAVEKATERKFSAGEVLATRIIQMKDRGVMRVISGPLTSVFQLSYESADLDSLKKELEFALSESGLDTVFKDIGVYQGSGHLDVIQFNKGSLGLLTIADNRVMD